MQIAEYKPEKSGFVKLWEVSAAISGNDKRMALATKNRWTAELTKTLLEQMQKENPDFRLSVLPRAKPEKQIAQ